MAWTTSKNETGLGKYKLNARSHGGREKKFERWGAGNSLGAQLAIPAGRVEGGKETRTGGLAHMPAAKKVYKKKYDKA